LGSPVSDQTVEHILKRHGIPPAPDRQLTTTWTECIRTHLDLLGATDVFTTEVWTWTGLITYYVLFLMCPHCSRQSIPLVVNICSSTKGAR
jgi:hypothetical protein